MKRDIFTRNLIYKYWIQETMLNMLHQIWIINALTCEAARHDPGHAVHGLLR